MENETWIIVRGDEVIRKKAAMGVGSLPPLERLIYCFWVPDYGMRNAGDLRAAVQLHADFQREGAKLAKEPGLSKTAEAFGLSKKKLEKDYFELFDGVCEELKRAG